MSISTRHGDSTTSAAQWLESFLERVCQPTYHLSNPIITLEREFEKARLDDTLALVNRKITYLERKRRDIVFREVVEETVMRGMAGMEMERRRCFVGKARVQAVQGNAHQALSASAKQVVRASDPFPFSSIDNKPRINFHTKTDKEKASKLRINCKDAAPSDINAKTLMLDNERKIEWFKKLRTDVRRALRARERIFSSVYRVPVEVWGRIFLFCLPSGLERDDDEADTSTDADSDRKGEGSSAYPTPSPHTAPLLLCAVCHTWRVAAIQTPVLWSALTVSLSISAKRTPRLPGLQTWLARAGDTGPLDLYVRWGVGPGSGSGSGKVQELEECGEVLDYLCTLAGRWRRLRLRVVKGKGKGEVWWHWHANVFASRAARMLGEPMPRLEELEMEPYTTVCAEGLRRNALRLKTLRMVGTGVALSPMGLLTGAGAPWTSLKSFTSRYPLDVPRALKILKICPALEECDLAVVACAAAPYAHARVTPVVRARCLRRLVVRETRPRVVDALLRVLALPVMQELRVYAESGNWSCESREGLGVRKLLMMVVRSGELVDAGSEVVCSRLRKLVIQGLECDEGALRCLVSLDMKNTLVEVGGSWVENLRV